MMRVSSQLPSFLLLDGQSVSSLFFWGKTVANTAKTADTENAEISFFSKHSMGRFSKYTETLEELYTEHPYSHHLVSIVNIWLCWFILSFLDAFQEELQAAEHIAG